MEASQNYVEYDMANFGWERQPGSKIYFGRIEKRMINESMNLRLKNPVNLRAWMRITPILTGIKLFILGLI